MMILPSKNILNDTISLMNKLIIIDKYMNKYNEIKKINKNNNKQISKLMNK